MILTHSNNICISTTSFILLNPILSSISYTYQLQYFILYSMYLLFVLILRLRVFRKPFPEHVAHGYYSDQEAFDSAFHLSFSLFTLLITYIRNFRKFICFCADGV